MKIDLHIHTRSCSDGNLTVDEVFEEASKRKIEVISITDHDCIDCQERAIHLARRLAMTYIVGVELNVTFEYPAGGATARQVSLDFLGYQYDIHNRELGDKLRLIAQHREERARQIVERINAEFEREGKDRFTEDDLREIQDSVDGVFGRPHIADHLVKKGIVKDRQEAFDRYLVKCDIPKYPLSLPQASSLVREAGGLLVLAHPADPNGTSLHSVARDLGVQTKIVKESMLEYIDGVECWHARNDERTSRHYVEFARKHRLIMTGGSDCHQKPIIMGTLDIPDWVPDQFGTRTRKAGSKSKGALV